jgi:hypothetical protein
MIVQCANPACARPLRYLFGGRLFQFGVRAHDAERNSHLKLARRVAHFWLCGQCSSTLSLTFDLREGVKVVPLVPLAITQVAVAGEQLPAEP